MSGRISSVTSGVYNWCAIVGLLLTLCCFTCAGFANYKDWFSVQTSRTPSFGLWSVCYNGDWGNCLDPLQVNQYDYDAALIAARIFIVLSVIVLLFLVVVASASILGSQKVNDTNPIIFPVLCIVIVVFQVLGNSIFEGAVRRRVTRNLTPYGFPRVDSEFGWAGISAWLAMGLTCATFVVYIVYFVLHRRATRDLETEGYGQPEDMKMENWRNGENDEE